MKKLILFLSLLLIHNSIPFSQNILHQKSSEQTDYWNMAFYGGALFNLIDNIDKDNKFRTGYIGGFDLSYDMKGRKSAIVITANYGRIKYTYNYSPEFDSYKEYYEITFGPRFYLGKGYFAETLLGNYIINYTSTRPDPVGLEYQSGFFGKGFYVCFGAGACVGTRVKLTGDFDLIIKGRMNYLLPELKSVLSFGLTSGIVFLNKKIEPVVEKQYSKNGTWSITVSGGINNPELFRSVDYKAGGHIDVEGAYRSAPKFEVYGNLEYNEIKRNPEHSAGRSIIDLNFGPRFLFGKEKYLSFFEMGMGLYIQDYLNTYYSNGDIPYMGINFGTGIIINVNEHIGFPVKGKIHMIFNGNDKPGGYLTATGGLRYTP
jgi:hypothetical protein